MYHWDIDGAFLVAYLIIATICVAVPLLSVAVYLAFDRASAYRNVLASFMFGVLGAVCGSTVFYNASSHSPPLPAFVVAGMWLFGWIGAILMTATSAMLSRPGETRWRRSSWSTIGVILLIAACLASIYVVWFVLSDLPIG